MSSWIIGSSLRFRFVVLAAAFALLLTGAGETIVVRIFGAELPVLREKAHEVEQALKDVPVLAELHAEQQVDVPLGEYKERQATQMRGQQWEV